LHISNSRPAFRREGRDDVREPCPEVRYVNIGAVERRGAGDDGAVQVIALAESAPLAAQALAMELDIRAHPI
jgi:hypothetical protein